MEEEPKPPEWKHVERLPIQEKTIEVLKKVKEAAEAELADLRATLDKIKYGTLWPSGKALRSKYRGRASLTGSRTRFKPW